MPQRLVRLITENQPCVVMTGAGVATESGIPDFRSPTGIWAKIDPMEYATLSAFRKNPEKVWWFYRKRMEMLVDAKPNATHWCLREMEELGLLQAIVTQNIDMLHHKAGSKEVIEVHGSIRTSSCQECGGSHSLARVLKLLGAGVRLPLCDFCGGILKPDVVFFEEALPLNSMNQACAQVRESGLLIVVGSTLAVYPVAGLPELAATSGAQVAIVNLGPTSFDRQATLKIDRAAGETFQVVLDLLRRSIQPGGLGAGSLEE